MNLIKTERGFERIEHDPYATSMSTLPQRRLVQQSSSIGDYEDSFDKPGSSYLWVGENHHLDRAEVKELVSHLQAWLKTGSLSLAKEE